ncbi:Homoserine kinase [Neolecta irregularis DAH-3]|uniref:Homoserine kinase n=1 Tax=Neolecta irregularis (strain DAH-3) TaxID=1198029 RepID=A0A1U7LWN2_NEOID|nr:Homoserine kinase [Neolecta irregularis DAH-3]|eukprot:OLL27028.1 Homoserine kinase [Neolecta irregularis DAH-3]
MTSFRKYKITVPCSSANIGPGFDVVGLALSMYLTIVLIISPSAETPNSHDSFNCKITYEGEGKNHISLQTDHNLITRTALYVLKCHSINKFPSYTTIHIDNQIPLGRGLGSSGAAVIAGVLLGNTTGQLNLSKDRMMDYALMIERHPDNVTAAMMGGFVGSYLNELDPKDAERVEIPLSEVLPEPAGGIDTGRQPPKPPMQIGHYIKFGWAKEIKAIAVIPNFEVATATSRGVLPTVYPKKDLIFNLQRLAVLTTALTRSPPDPNLIFQAMQDKIHQPYRARLIPGLPEILASVTPETDEGLLGICLSGAGPTILALAVTNFDSIAANIVKRFNAEGILCIVKVLELARDGSQIQEL